jgi:FtsH-binding integral membrane protein
MSIGMSETTTMSTRVQRLAAVLAGLVLVCVAPAATNVNLAAAPNWARVLLLGGGLLLVYLAWLAISPCREALWSIACVFAIAAACGVLTMAVVLFFPRDQPLPLDLGDGRVFVAAWSALVAALLSCGSIIAGRLAVAGEQP